MCHHPTDESLQELSEDDREELLADHDRAELAEAFSDEELDEIGATSSAVGQ